MKAKLSIVLFFLVFSIFLSAFEIAFGQLQLEESRLLEIDVNSEGSATWIITRRYSLKTEDDIQIFQLYLSEFETRKEEYLKTFSDNMRAMVDRASNFTGRNMTAKDFAIDATILQTPTGSVGVIYYQCIWVGFALVEEPQIRIGDVFEVGFFLFENDELTIRCPQGYEILEVWPVPDMRINYERTLTWYGPKSFGAEEPRVLLEKETSGVIDFLQAFGTLIALAVIGVCLGAVLFYRFEKKRKKKTEREAPRVMPELESDEDKVVRLLKTMGGRAHQSTIGEKCGFSKSKTSQLLKNMENAGIVRREKRGREKLVILLRLEENDKNS
jgi:uncharacterized membrane protein